MCRLFDGMTVIPNTPLDKFRSLRPPLNLRVNLALITSFLLPRKIYQLGFTPRSLFVGFR